MALKRSHAELELDDPGAVTISHQTQISKAMHLPQPNIDTNNFLLHAVGSYRWAPIHDTLHSMLETKDRLALSATSRGFREGLRNTVWSINKKLARFFDQPEAFRTQLGKSNALISGGFALQFLEGVTWEGSDLDIFVEKGQDAQAMEQYLLSAGYQQGPGHRSHMPCWRALSSGPESAAECKIYLKGEIEAKESQVKVKVIATRSVPVLCILRSFFTTCIINIITWNKAFCVFPRATFLYHYTVAVQRLDSHFGSLHAKYSKRGWRMWTHPIRPTAARDLFGINEPRDDHRCRRVGDSGCWVLNLNTSGVKRPSMPDFVIECTDFEVRRTLDDSQDTPSVQQSIPFFLLGLIESPVLRFRYASQCLRGMPEIFDRATEFQLGKATGRDRARLFRNGRVNRKAKCDVDGWDYMDEDVSHLVDEYIRNPDDMLKKMGYHVD
ncbi:hypothetical protein GGR57DRAFT_514875 [Xylariaceae sp. FL1272]|nr:hypothetical protein GGR57DRAFT_514875 [Xylariaceae sp. FL1272]